MKEKKIMKELILIFWLFIIGSVLGYLYEMVLVLFQKGYFESRQGLIYGPFTPVYGIGAVMYYFILHNIKTKNKVRVFFITMLLGGITEYLCSFIQEKAFGTISWDYSYLFFNINGRTSLLHCTYWGIAGLLYITYIDPLLEKLRQNISCLAANRQSERKKGIEAENKIHIFLDKYYPDEYIDKIFANKKDVSFTGEK